MMGPHLGLLNESCQTSSDCQSPLACIGGSCSVVNYGLTATGKSCAECNTAADCCELPDQHFRELLPGVWYTESPTAAPSLTERGGLTGGPPCSLNAAILRCQDLLAFIGGDATICAGAASFTAGRGPVSRAACFLYNTYCGSCGANGPWAATRAASASTRRRALLTEPVRPMQRPTRVRPRRVCTPDSARRAPRPTAERAAPARPAARSTRIAPGRSRRTPTMPAAPPMREAATAPAIRARSLLLQVQQRPRLRGRQGVRFDDAPVQDADLHVGPRLHRVAPTTRWPSA